MIFVAWGGVLFALIFEGVYKARYFAATAAGLGTLCLILADNVPILDGKVDNDSTLPHLAAMALAHARWQIRIC